MKPRRKRGKKRKKGRKGRFKDLFLEHNRTDNGREYVNQNLERILKKLGIKYQLTVPYSSQNGLAKRMNRTLVEKARFMLIEANP